MTLKFTWVRAIAGAIAACIVGALVSLVRNRRAASGDAG